MKVGKKILSWDTCEIAEAEAEYRFDNDNEDNLTKEELLERAYGDEDLYAREWEYMTDALTDDMLKKNPDSYWYCEVKGFGWRNLDGHTYIKADTGEELLRRILPKCDCTFYIHNYGKGFAIHNYHHDSPTGEWYYVNGISAKRYEKEA